MKTVNLSGYADPEFLRQFAPRILLWLLAEHREFLAERGVQLPTEADLLAAHGEAALDYDGLAQIFQAEDDLPRPMVDRLFLVKDMSGPQQIEQLLEALAERQLPLPVSPNECSPADLAAQCYQQHPQLFQDLHAQTAVKRYRSFAHLMPRGRRRVPVLPASVAGLERTLNSWYDAQGMDRSARVCQRRSDREIVFYVRHGKRVRREGAVRLKTCESESQIYRPERFGLVIYSEHTGELRVHADSDKEQNLFRVAFGLHLFADGNYFQHNTHKFCLQALLAGPSSLAWAGLPGIRSVRLQELKLAFGKNHEVKTRFKAPDVYAQLDYLRFKFAPQTIVRLATFGVELEGQPDPVRCTLRPPNDATFPDGSEARIMPWLIRQKMAHACPDETSGPGDFTLELTPTDRP